MEFGIITQGYRLREIRKKLGLKQEDVSGNEITRNLVSMIETDKATLTHKAAKVIHSNLKEVIKKRNIKCDVNIDEIFITEEEQAEEIFERYLRYIEEVDVLAEEKLENMLFLLNKYNMNINKVFMYKKLAEKFEALNKFEKALKYFNLANEFAVMSNVENEIHEEIILSITHCCRELELHEETLRVINKYLVNIEEKDISKSNYIKILYNKSITLKFLGKYDQALETLKEIELSYSKKIIDNCIFIKSEMIKGNCYKEKGYYSKALSIHKKIYKKLSKSKEKSIYDILALANILEIGRIIGEDVVEYIDDIINKIDQYEKFDEYELAGEICNIVAEACENSNINDGEELAIEYYYKALELSKDKKNKEVIDVSVSRILDKVIKKEDSSEINNIRGEILELLSLKLIMVNSKVVMTLLGYYMKKEDFGKVQGIIKYCEERVS
ncbi:helix-turn-helix domain-containing protein [Oceanirhabdus sp. W0125-5]|uniref:helix-turn-helix domain-containing protein n=1 Tax=Oceanirhabdus sp. W0125-5 TaxID=2999116 RepID=UPI0022F2CA95|nr:helix-turn-helix transcriptional regulator [Oceanirhabdus sp. W0125-5]WBW96441.1 helix-turn-helix transcriptional regulator [Oceanirhabdus sp. W0125-5]